MRLKICHHTRYAYEGPVRFFQHLLYLRPRESPLLRVQYFKLVLPPEARIQWMMDDFDNLAASLYGLSDASSLQINSECQVETTGAQPFDFLIRDYASKFPFEYEPLHRHNLGIYLDSDNGSDSQALRHWLQLRLCKGEVDTVAFLVELNQAIHRSIEYQRREEPGIQSALQTTQLGTGTCRDYAVLLVACARLLGVAARFVSGYLFDPGLLNSGVAGDMHAWAEVFLPGAGWRGLDPSHGIFCDQAYVPVAHAVVPESVNPIQGSFHGSSSATLNAAITVRRLN